MGRSHPRGLRSEYLAVIFVALLTCGVLSATPRTASADICLGDSCPPPTQSFGDWLGTQGVALDQVVGAEIPPASTIPGNPVINWGDAISAINHSSRFASLIPQEPFFPAAKIMLVNVSKLRPSMPAGHALCNAVQRNTGGINALRTALGRGRVNHLATTGPSLVIYFIPQDPVIPPDPC